MRDGHLSLSGLQMRAHALFSAQGVPLGSDTLEYAWLIDMQAGGLTGRVTLPQVCVFAWAEGLSPDVLECERVMMSAVWTQSYDYFTKCTFFYELQQLDTMTGKTCAI